MKVLGKDLHHLPVETQSGQKLGRIVDFEVDVESHLILTYLVRPSRLSNPLVQSELRIDRAQVVALTPERMVVQDSIGRITIAENRRGRPRFVKEASPAMPRQAN